MDDNIVKFPGTNDNEYDEVQEMIEDEDSETIVIVYNSEGKFSFVASNPDIREMIFQLELSKNLLINNYLNNGQTEF